MYILCDPRFAHARHANNNLRMALDATDVEGLLALPPDAPSLTMWVDGSRIRQGGIAGPSALQRAPDVVVNTTAMSAKHRASRRYTLVLVDPDGEYLHFRGASYAHWIVTGIRLPKPPKPDARQPTYAVTAKKGGGARLLKFRAPKFEAGVHRLVLVLFEETEKDVRWRKPKKRGGFVLAEFAERHELIPASATYIVAVADEDIDQGAEYFTEEIRKMREEWVKTTEVGWWN